MDFVHCLVLKITINNTAVRSGDMFDLRSQAKNKFDTLFLRFRKGKILTVLRPVVCSLMKGTDPVYETVLVLLQLTHGHRQSA